MAHSPPLMIELFCGLHGWAEGADGWRVVGFDLYDMCGELGVHRPAGDIQLVLQDILTLHGSQFKDAALIVASPPCQEFSYMAMPWSLAKEKQRAIEADPAEQKRLTALFDACFRIQREACEAAGRHIPMVVENVRGAQKWVGRSRWNFGSFHLWGDLPALMPMARVFKSSGMNWSDRSIKGQDFTRIAGRQALAGGIKQGGDWFAEARSGGAGGTSASLGSKSKARKARKAASAMIAKIPFELSRYIAATFYPTQLT
jgi:hypothetical protein